MPTQLLWVTCWRSDAIAVALERALKYDGGVYFQAKTDGVIRMLSPM